MKITDIKIRKLTEDEKMKAIVSVTFDDELVIHDIKVIKGIDKYFIAMPSRKTFDGHFVDIAHPINADMRTTLETAVIDAYLQVKEEQVANQDQAPLDAPVPQERQPSDDI